MNKVILKGRLTRNPDVKYVGEREPFICVARFTLACADRERKSEDGSIPANFIPCVCMGKLAEIADNNLCKGKEVLVCGKMQSGCYVNKEGKKTYTLECFVTEIEFCGKKEQEPPSTAKDGFMDIPEEWMADELPFR